MFQFILTVARGTSRASLSHESCSYHSTGRNAEKDDSSSSEDAEDESEDIDDDLTPPLLD